MALDVVKGSSELGEVDLGLGKVDLTKLVTAPARESMAKVNAVQVLSNFIQFGDVDPESAAMLPELTEVISVLASVGKILDQREAEQKKVEAATSATGVPVTRGYVRGAPPTTTPTTTTAPAAAPAIPAGAPTPDLKMGSTTPVLKR